MEYRIRDVKETDLPRIAEIEILCFSKPWTEAMLLDELLLPEGSFLAAADENDCVIGYISARNYLGDCYIGNLAVHPGYRRFGIGERLLQKMIERSRADGGLFVSLEVRVSNLPARALYEKRGFRFMGERKNYYSAPVENAAIYTLFFE